MLTAPVDERVLTNTVALRGVVTAAATVTLSPTAGTGKPVVTGVRVRQGDQVKAGQVLLEISGRPIIALPGDVPAYRDLRPGAKGTARSCRPA